MSPIANPRAVSTWSLRRTLGNAVAPDSAVSGGPFMQLPARHGGRTLMELIPDIAAHGYTSLHICHFHLETRDPAYLAEVRAALADNDIALEMLLIDDGDLTAPDIDRHLAWYDNWLDAAEALGAERARIGAGRSAPTPERLRTSGEHLARLARHHPGVRVVTENWMEATPDAASVLAVLDAAGAKVGLLIDLANWHEPEKYAELAVIAPRAEACHAKCPFSAEGEPDEADFRATLGILRDVNYNGALTLIYDGPDDDEWTGLDREWSIATDVFGPPVAG